MIENFTYYQKPSGAVYETIEAVLTYEEDGEAIKKIVGSGGPRVEDGDKEISKEEYDKLDTNRMPERIAEFNKQAAKSRSEARAKLLKSIKGKKPEEALAELIEALI